MKGSARAFTPNKFSIKLTKLEIPRRYTYLPSSLARAKGRLFPQKLISLNSINYEFIHSSLSVELSSE
jgi:hypothetical protein